MVLRGWVYIVTHQAMPELLKVGYSLRDPALRAKELEGTGVPGAYCVVYAALVYEPRSIEQAVHAELADMREGKEWFRCSVSVAFAALCKVAGDGILYECRSAPDELFTGYVVQPCLRCGKWLRLPSNMEIVITCPKCKGQFSRTSDGQMKSHRDS